MSNTTAETKGGVDADRAQQTTENIRYGQNISESGMGGMTNSGGIGSAKQEGGYGGTKADAELEGDKNPRGAQQYSVNDGDGSHDHNIGA